MLVLGGLVALVARAAPDAPRPPPPAAGPAPLVDAVLVGPRALVRCLADRPATLEVDGALVVMGARPLGPRAVVGAPKRDGVATCVTEDGARGAARLQPLRVQAVAPSVVRGPAARVILGLEGQALGPRVAADDGVYLVFRGAIVPAALACPEQRWSDERVVACVELERVRGRGPARVRIQAAGRLEEAAGAPIDLDAVRGDR